MTIVNVGQKVIVKQLRAARFKKGWTYAPYVKRTPSEAQRNVIRVFTAASRATAGLPLKDRLPLIAQTLRGHTYSDIKSIPLSQAKPTSRDEAIRLLNVVRSQIPGLVRPQVKEAKTSPPNEGEIREILTGVRPAVGGRRRGGGSELLTVG
jgi:hypothetical protein